jgi:hypothetical protein
MILISSGFGVVLGKHLEVGELVGNLRAGGCNHEHQRGAGKGEAVRDLHRGLLSKYCQAWGAW